MQYTSYFSETTVSLSNLSKSAKYRRELQISLKLCLKYYKEAKVVRKAVHLRISREMQYDGSRQVPAGWQGNRSTIFVPAEQTQGTGKACRAMICLLG